MKTQIAQTPFGHYRNPPHFGPCTQTPWTESISYKKKTNIESVIRKDDTANLELNSITAALSLSLAPLLAVLFDASVPSTAFKQVSCASGWWNTAALDWFWAKNTVRIGVMLNRFATTESATLVPEVLNAATWVNELLFGSVG